MSGDQTDVSMPFKTAVIPFLDRLDPAAQAIGAVNTINNSEGVLTGYNTDYNSLKHGFLHVLCFGTRVSRP